MDTPNTLLNGSVLDLAAILRDTLETTLRRLGYEPKAKALEVRRVPLEGRWGYASAVCKSARIPVISFVRASRFEKLPPVAVFFSSVRLVLSWPTAAASASTSPRPSAVMPRPSVGVVIGPMYQAHRRLTTS